MSSDIDNHKYQAINTNSRKLIMLAPLKIEIKVSPNTINRDIHHNIYDN